MLDLKRQSVEQKILSGLVRRSLSNKKQTWLIWGVLFAVFLSFAMGFWSFQRLRKLEHKQNDLRSDLKRIKSEALPTHHLGKTPVPGKLAGIPFGEDLGVVLAVKKVSIRNVTAPYNPGLISSPSGYDLFFRYDLKKSRLKYAPFGSYVGVVALDRQFQQMGEEFKKVELNTDYADDPRVLFVGNQLYLFCNQLDEQHPKCRFMSATHLDPTSYQVKSNILLDMNLRWVEKNWSPFEYIGEDGKPQLFLEYQISPRKLLKLPNPEVNELQQVIVPPEEAYLSLPWPRTWGRISGSTPPLLIDGEYIGFFHSWFVDANQVVWYVMGAYTFDAHPPFSLTRISKYPLLFKEIYETPCRHTASVKKRVIFPSGCIAERQQERTLLHLACGENDCAIKIVTIDKEELLKTMLELREKNQ